MSGNQNTYALRARPPYSTWGLAGSARSESAEYLPRAENADRFSSLAYQDTQAANVHVPWWFGETESHQGEA